MTSNDLSDRLSQAASNPARSITVAQLKEETGRHRRRQAFGGAVVALVAAAGLVAGLVGGGSGGTDRQSISPISSAPPASGPVVSATPTTGLMDGEIIMVRGSGFTPEAQIAMVTCGVESKTLANKQDACAVGQAQYTFANPQGRVAAQYVVQRTIDTAKLGTVDCASAPARCRLGIGQIKSQQGASVLLTFSSRLQAVTVPTMTLAYDKYGHLIGSTPELSGKGFGANVSVDIRQCLVNTDCGSFPVVRTITTDRSGEFTTQLSLQTIVHLTTGDDASCVLHCKLVASVQPNPYETVASTPEYNLSSLIPVAKECDLGAMSASSAGWTTLDNGDRSLAINLRNTGSTGCSLLGYPSVQASKAGRVVSGERLAPSKISNGVILSAGGSARFQVVVSDCGTDPDAFDTLDISLFGADVHRSVAVPAQPARTKVGFCVESGTQNLTVGQFG